MRFPALFEAHFIQRQPFGLGQFGDDFARESVGSDQLKGIVTVEDRLALLLIEGTLK